MKKSRFSTILDMYFECNFTSEEILSRLLDSPDFLDVIENTNLMFDSETDTIIDSGEMKMKKQLFINNKLVKANYFGFDECHKIYIIENNQDMLELLKWDYKIYNINEISDIFENSCPLRFISSADLTKTFVHQGENAKFEWKK